jgi:hypothetical protein
MMLVVVGRVEGDGSWSVDAVAEKKTLGCVALVTGDRARLTGDADEEKKEEVNTGALY